MIAIFTAYINKKKYIKLSNGELLRNNIQINIYYFIAKMLTPILLFIVIISSLGVIKF
ncbi:sodium transporter family protein [Clostridium botulinum A1 str. CFSAN002368]|nr:sodium transporter family protein [Clostridium botulinum A1 str. CFSAN002368]